MKSFFLAFPAVFILAGCQTLGSVGDSLGSLGVTDEKITTIPQGDCPGISRLAELASFYTFATPAAPVPDEKVSEAHITRVDSTCGMAGDQLVLDVTLGVDGAVGPKGRRVPSEKPSFMYPYFIALLDSQNKILFKDMHAFSIAYDAQLNQSSQEETVHVRIPAAALNGAAPRDMRVLVGFQLGPDEVRYNRLLPTGQLGKTLSPTADRASAPAPSPAGSSEATIERLKKGN